MTDDRVGTDLILLEIATAALQQAKWPIRVMTGELAFQVGENDRNAKTSNQDIAFNDSQRVKFGDGVHTQSNL